jgi:hypothetical protein
MRTLCLLAYPLFVHRRPVRAEVGRGAPDNREGELERMSDEIVRCPYCVLGNEFRPMIRRSKNWFICLSCGHLATPNVLYSKCACSKCQEMNRIASRCRGSEELRRSLPPDLPARL